LAVSIVLLTQTFYSQQNLKSNYTPLKSSGKLPAVFTQNVRDIIRSEQEVLGKSNESQKSIKRQYITSTNYGIEQIVRSGDVLVNDEITKYLNKITDIILKNEPELRQQITIFTLKSPVVNAYSFDKGYVFIDIGLISQMESEAQLAYVICHEISHYRLHHHIKGYLIDNQKRSWIENLKIYQRRIERCQYSKEAETEADLEGLKLFLGTSYSTKDLEKVFDVLQYSHLPFELIELKKSFFETPGYSIPVNYFLKAVSPIVDNSNADDKEQTHPNTVKRKLAIREKIDNQVENAGKVAFINRQNFEYIRDVARMEICRLYLKRRDFGNAFYAAYILYQKYPSNEYLAEVLSKSMYAFVLYRNDSIRFSENSKLPERISDYASVESYPQQLYYFINKIPKNELNIIALNFIYRKAKMFPGNKVIREYSDKLFTMVERSDWGISDFRRIAKEDQNFSSVKPDSLKLPVSKTDLIGKSTRLTSDKRLEDSVYYKDIFLDLFQNDQQFKKRFPMRSTYHDVLAVETVEERYARNWFKNDVEVSKILLLEPFYHSFSIDLLDEQRYSPLKSDLKQERLIEKVSKCAAVLNLGLATLDPGLMTAEDIAKMNDYSVVSDWLEECSDSDQRSPVIFNTNEINRIIETYGTGYVLKVGLVSVTKNVRGATLFHAELTDLRRNEVVYRKHETIYLKDNSDLVNAKACEMIYEIKHCKKSKIKKST